MNKVATLANQLLWLIKHSEKKGKYPKRNNVHNNLNKERKHAAKSITWMTTSKISPHRHIKTTTKLLKKRESRSLNTYTYSQHHNFNNT